MYGLRITLIQNIYCKMFSIVYRLLDKRSERIICESYEEAMGYCEILAKDGCTFKCYEDNKLIAKSRVWYYNTVYVSHTMYGFNKYIKPKL
jgi:hypothetical protein